VYHCRKGICHGNHWGQYVYTTMEEETGMDTSWGVLQVPLLVKQIYKLIVGFYVQA